MDSECSSLLDELQTIWNDVGETDAEKDVMLLELEQECLEIYRRKVVQANGHRTQLRQSIVDSEGEIVTICSALGETPVHLRQNKEALKEELKFITTQLEGMRERRNRRLGQFLKVVEQIHCISKEISPENGPSEILLDEHDLSLRKLEDLQKQLDLLQKEKVEEEVRRLEGVKASKMKDLVLKKKLELDELCRRTHLVDQTNLSTESAVEAY
ncbi:hypothetical protein HPP92_002829 [Vanilla planifolia]|uniref:Uncharacterized protein n=1 Tax=Vanilla planifolia TaxID=51239 RepID=A0A835S688_VANPL|nr:hypothetical protein HPP92_002829 [Vanilla planifolia]